MSTEEVFDRVIALRALTKSTGVRTTRTQGQLLESLSGPQLAEVALMLDRAEQLSPLFYDKKREENARTTTTPTTLRQA